jgi:geranylgeranyl diphosphate synthase type I
MEAQPFRIAEPAIHIDEARPSWLQILRMEVDTHLVEFFEEKRWETNHVSPPTLELVDAIEALTMRGGKRLRPAVAAAGYRCIRPGEGMDRLIELGASLELLQSYLLIHDDWMDGDEVRRGGPSVHAVLQREHRNVHLGSALGVLAGDLASAYAWELFLRAPYPTQAWPSAMASFLTTQKEVYCGQHLDLTANGDIARMHALKTTSYSVRGPVLLGALLGSPSKRQLQALSDWAAPIGEAFQIRDDLLGALGSPGSTGKPGMDIPHGKLTSVLSELRRITEPEERRPVEAIVGRADAPHRELDAAQRCLRHSGIVERLEDRIEALRTKAAQTLDEAAFNPQGRAMLTELADKLTIRRA